MRRPPRGVARTAFASRDYYDVWLPELAPSATLLSDALSEAWTDRRWSRFVRAYRREMRLPPSAHLLATLAVLSHSSSFAVGCYCGDAARCHRTVLRDLLVEAGACVSDAQ